MSLEVFGHGTWRCEPALAVFLASRVVWGTEGDLLVKDLERHNPIAKRLRVTTERQLILVVHCMLNGAQDTSVDFLVPQGLTRAERGFSRQFVASALRLAVLERLLQRPVGFRA